MAVAKFAETLECSRSYSSILFPVARADSTHKRMYILINNFVFKTNSVLKTLLLGDSILTGRTVGSRWLSLQDEPHGEGSHKDRQTGRQMRSCTVNKTKLVSAGRLLLQAEGKLDHQYAKEIHNIDRIIERSWRNKGIVSSSSLKSVKRKMYEMLR